MLVYKLSQINTISKKVSNNLFSENYLFLYGELGSGKTTFARSLINHLQKKNKVKMTEVLSPTFNLLYEYDIKSLKVMHYDLYRLNSLKEIYELGIFEKKANSLKIVEWPEKIKSKIKNRLDISLFYNKDKETRKINFKGFGLWKKFFLNEI
tara:strand:+ start:883 stop:1338 length:456 start_codon:yes stop_codon:yes gene_type:complete